MPVSPSIVWFRQDLRLDENPAVSAAVKRGGPIIPVFIWSPEEEGDWPPGAASRWWLHHSLKALDASLRKRGSRLTLMRGKTEALLIRAAMESGAETIYCNRRYEPSALSVEASLRKRFEEEDLEFKAFNGSLFFDPAKVTSKTGGPYRVFTPFSKACFEAGLEDRLFAAPRQFAAPASWPKSVELEDLGLLPKVRWDEEIAKVWDPGEVAAQKALEQFAAQGLDDYAEGRNRPDQDLVSRLSPHLHFGEVSVQRVAHVVRCHSKAPDSFLREVLWREFSYHLLYHFPETPTKPLDRRFNSFPWEDDPIALRKWRKGRTGYPMVDAGMRQLWSTGYMHNRVRMIVASFLTKDLLIPWQEGARWFWDTLVDADLANNTLGWQWTAGCGADAAPFFRIFNPVTQGLKFDPQGKYVRRWLPDLENMRNGLVHQPWQTERTAYPERMVDHESARKRALAAFESIKSGS
jgi:deoxyribodipyrimidine photo-lyase